MTRAAQITQAVNALRKARAAPPMTSGTLFAPPERRLTQSSLQLRAPYSCPECGHLLRVSGLGRHRVYFELDDKRAKHPVMNRICPECGDGLPGKNPL